MLFLESNALSYVVEGDGRTRLLRDLQEQNLIPLIRSARLRFFEDALRGPQGVGEMEATMASWTESATREPYVQGDVFCFQDHVLFLIFDDDERAMRAGIVYEARTAEPFRKLDSFCQNVRELLLSYRQRENVEEFPQWTSGKPSVPEGFRGFVAKQDADSLYTSLRKETMGKRILAASNLEDEGARIFLRTARDAHLEGYATKLLTGETASYKVQLERLEDVGLVEREVQVSCRKTGHALFRLPNAHALAVVTVSDATCSECGSPVADENVEEVIAPTKLASSLLEDGSWLVSRLHFLLREMGVPDREIAVGPSEGTGYGQLMANVCGESFLLVTRDGDLTPAFARWAIDLELETEACHLVIVATGRLHKEAGVLLQNHARRRISGGQDFEMILADDVAAAGRELENALERVSQRVIAERLCVLDDNIGLNVSRLVQAKFQLQYTSEGADSKIVGGEIESPSSAPKQLLSLAAHASSNVGEVFDIDAIPQESSNADQHTEGEDVGSHLNPDTQASWE